MTARRSPRVALVTGAASGIGRAIARRLAADGATVGLLDIDADGLRGTLDMISDRGGSGMILAASTADAAQVDAALDAFTAQSGSLDTCVIAAGVGTTYGPIESLSTDEFDRVMGVNVRGAFLVMRRAIPLIRAAGGGSVTAIASVDGLLAETGLAAYCASKAALVNLCRVVALDVAREGIRVNIVCPSATDTPMIRARLEPLPDGAARIAAIADRHPIDRLLDPDEIAATVAFLASGHASGITGASIVVDLGLTAGWEAYRTPDWLERT